MQPAALRDLPGLRTHFDPDRGADQSRSGQGLDEAVGGCPETEGHLVDAVQGWLELDHAVEFLRWAPRDHGTAVETAGEGVHSRARLAEASAHVVGV